MILDEVAALLKVLAAYDGRNVGEADLMVWGRQMADVAIEDAVEAVHEHYGMTRDWAYPSDIRRFAERFRNRRNRRPEVIAPGCVEPDPVERRRLAPSADGLLALPITSGTETDRSSEIKEFAKARFREVLPEGDPDALRHGRRYWRQEQTAWKRQLGGEPNPYFNPAMAGPVDDVVPETTRSGEAWWTDDRARERHATRLLAEAGRLRPITEGDAA